MVDAGLEAPRPMVEELSADPNEPSAAIPAALASSPTLSARAAVAGHLATILEQSPDGIVLTDREGRLSAWNPAAASLLGSGDLAVDVALHEVVPGIDTTLYARIRTEGPLRIELHVGSGAGARPSGGGAEDDGGRVVEFSLAPASGPGGEFVGIVGIVRDVTRQRRFAVERARLLASERQARLDAERSEEEVRAVVENMPELAWSCGPDGDIDYFNQRVYAYTGARFEDMRGWSWEALVHPAQRAEVREHWQDSLASGQPFEMEFPMRGADGAYRWFLTRVRPLRNRDGGIVRWFGVSTNIDRQKRLEAERERLIFELERGNRELEQFAYVASHDLRAPLRGIANLSRWIEDGLADRMTDEVRQHMDLMRSRVRRLEKLIDGILEYSRAGRMRHKLEVVDVAGLLGESLDLLAPPPGAVLLPAGMPVLRTERVPLQQVFLNLLSNGLKYTRRPDPRVEVGVRELADQWEFSVTDNGPGIAPQNHERIWAVFQTLHSRDLIESTGIGLSVVRKIVESKGGRAWVESREGQGATFRFTWPKDEPQVASE
jgi:PAS domain S-box-containing protein